MAKTNTKNQKTKTKSPGPKNKPTSPKAKAPKKTSPKANLSSSKKGVSKTSIKTSSKNKKISPTKEKDLKKTSRVLGVKDFSVNDYKFLNPIIKKLEETAWHYSFSKIENPILEDFSLYKKFLDKEKQKKLFFLESKGTDRTVLRPDLVHGLIRFFSEDNFLNNLDRPNKFFSIGSVFRQEKIRGGVYRQFSQFNFSIINDPKPVTDSFMIFLIYNIFKELQIDVQVQINSLGDAECQKEFLSKFSKFLKERGRRSKLCPECKKNILKSPALLLECQEDECLAIKNEMPQIIEFLSEESNNRFYKTVDFLDQLGINYNFNPYLTAGINYYNDLIFEIWPIDKNGEVNQKLALGRGGRYDQAFSKIASKEVSMIGFSGGLERTLIKARENDIFINNDEMVVFLAQVDFAAKAQSMALFKELLSKGFSVRQAFHLDSLKEQLEEARQEKARIILILGKKEINEETILFRDTESGTQEVIARKDLISYLERNLEN